jgi:hypothetical protein
MPNSVFDVYLGDILSLQGYRCRSLMRDSAPLVASKFSTGAQGETDLDLLKNKSLKSVQGGMFQRDWEDDQKAARVVGVFNRYDKNLYPAPPRSSSSSASGYPTAKAESEGMSFVAYGSFSASTYFNSIYKMTYGGGVSAVTLPAGLASNGISNISSMWFHKNYLFVNCNDTAGLEYRYDIANNTWQAISGGTSFFFTIRTNLYAINVPSDIYSVTNETAASAATFTFVTSAGSRDPSDKATHAIEFNGAAYISKPSGIYRFDGTNAIRVLTHYTNEMRVWNGAIYYVAGGWLYKFDGTTVTRIQFFGTQEIGAWGAPSMQLASNSDFLFIATIALTSAYTQIDKLNVGATALKRIYAYDGVGFTLMHETSITVGTYYTAGVVTTSRRLFDVLGLSNSAPTPVWTGTYYSFDLSTMYQASAVTANSLLEITTSEFDDGYPNVFKALETIAPNYTGMIAGDSIAVTYSYYDGTSWSSWITAGTLTSTSKNQIELTDATKKLFKRLKINVTATSPLAQPLF